MTLAGHLLPDLIQGRLIRRYKRFLADVCLNSGETVTAHCPNSGSMKGCAIPDSPVYLSRSDNPKRKLKYTWELVKLPHTFIGINTQVPNKLVRLTVAGGGIPALSGYDVIRPEVKTSAHTRLDLLLEKEGRRACYIEIKNCTLVENGVARFPDAVTTRGKKHLLELIGLARQGHRCVIFFLIQRSDAHRFSPADAIDPDYGRALRMCVENGVEIMAFDTQIDIRSICIGKPVPWVL